MGLGCLSSIVDDEANDFNYYRGNVYLKEVIGEDGKAQVISPDQLVYDTLPNGKVLLKRIPGQLQLQPVDEEETFLRQNFTQSENRNYREGSCFFKKIYRTGIKSPEELAEAFPGSSAMYDAPQTPRVA